jgi:hypothetical protein
VRRRRAASAGARAFDAWYTDGSVAGQHHRQDDGSGTKRIWWDPRGVEIARLALFGSRDLSGAGPVVVVEGERATLAVRAAGFDAVGTWGSNATPSDAALGPLRGRDVVLWADDDDPGRKQMAVIAEALGEGVRYITPPTDAPKGWDAADADPDLIRDLIAGAVPLDAGPAVKRLSDYQSTPVQWLWPGWLPRGTVTLFDGNPGEAKSTTVMELIARVTTGSAWPDGQLGGDPADVLIITREDDPSRVLRPRLEVSGADLERVLFLEDEFVMPRDADLLRRAITPSVALVFIDPLFSHIEGRIKTISDNDVRTAVMTPLSDIAAGTGIALLAMRHNSKDTSKSALMRGAGSLGGLAGAARSMWGAAPDPDDEDGTKKLFGVTKSNYAKKPPAYRYQVVSAVPPGQVWVGHSVSKIEWLGPSDLSIDDVLAEEDHAVARDAAAVLVDYLEAQGDSAPSQNVRAHMKSKGFGTTALDSAKKRAGVKSRKDGFGTGWTMFLPEEAEGSVARPFEGSQESANPTLGGNAEDSGASYRPHPWASSAPSASSKDPKNPKNPKERVLPAGARTHAREGDVEEPIEVSASPDQTITCRDYRAHQGEAHIRSAKGWICTICSREVESS